MGFHFPIQLGACLSHCAFLRDNSSGKILLYLARRCDSSKEKGRENIYDFNLVGFRNFISLLRSADLYLIYFVMVILHM